MDKVSESGGVSVKFWTRVTRNGREQWMLVEGRDESGVPEICWRKYNEAFWKRHLDGSLRPADEMACYQYGSMAMIKAAARLDGSAGADGSKPGVILRHASPVTYIVSAGLIRMKQFSREDVKPVREEQSKMFDVCRVNGQLDVRAYVENLPSLFSIDAVLADDLAKECVGETLAKCEIETRVGLRVYLESGLVAGEAARMLGVPRQTFAWRRDNHWFPEFRQKCSWSW